MTAAPAALPVPRLVLWRHGRTEWNAAGRFQGQLDPPLDDEGRRQAARVAPVLAAGLPAGDTVVVSSDLGRAVETASELTSVLGVPMRVDARLREHGLGCWEGLTRDEVADRYPDQYADWMAGRPVRGRGGEEAAQVVQRALAALADLPEAAVAVVVTHGGTAGRVLEALLGLGPEHRRVFGPLGNCAWSEVRYQEPRWRLLRHNSWVPAGVEGVGPVPGTGTRAGATPEEAAPPAAGDADAAS
ncbi:histidine phosphatase family protein [Geodermatophilus sp. SYSU D00815]